MVKLMKEDNLAECSLCICGVLEGIKYFLQSHYLPGFLVGDLPDVPVGPATHFLDQAVLA